MTGENSFDHDDSDSRFVDPERLTNEPTEAIDLNKLFGVGLTESGCYDLRKTSLETISQLLEAMPVPSVLVDGLYCLAYVNTAFLQLSGSYVNPGSLEFTSLFSSPAEADHGRNLLQKSFKADAPLVWESVFHIFKTRIWGRIHFRRLRVGSERIILIQIENLTAQKQLLLAAKYKKLVKIFPVGIGEFAFRTVNASDLSANSLIDKILHARIVDGNREFAGMHGFSNPRDLSGFTPMRLLPGGSLTRSIVQRWISSKFSTFSFETSQGGDLGEKRFFENTFIANIIDKSLIGFWWLKKDITGRKKQEQEFLRNQKIESLGILAGGIAHDFNNLLTGIVGNVSLLKKKLDSQSRFSPLFEDAEKACSMAKALTKQLLTFSKGGVPVKKEVNVKALIKDSVSFALRGSNIKCEWNISDHLWPVHLDEAQIRQVIQNLAINAIQSMPAGGRIHVKAENIDSRDHKYLPLTNHNYVRLSIRDQGKGIPQENLQKIFDPYFTSKPGGSGLGLAIAYSIIRKHNGLITVRSKVGVGSQFCFYLPIVSGGSGSASRETVIETIECPAESFPETPAKILLMDDDDLIRNLCSELLKHWGHEAVVAQNGEQAIKIYKDSVNSGAPFDLLILDLTIRGGMGGKDTLDAIRALNGHVRAVVSSGYCDDPIMSDYSRYGFIDVLPKPFTANDVEELLKRVLQRNPRSSICQ